jgi:hypothetical protein
VIAVVAAVSRGYLARLPLHAAVYSNAAGGLIAERVFDPGSDVTIGTGPTDGLIVSAWVGPSLLLISRGILLHLQSGMRLNMCHDSGEDRVQGTFDELIAAGMTMPIRINVSRLNIALGNGMSVFAKYVSDALRSEDHSAVDDSE